MISIVLHCDHDDDCTVEEGYKLDTLSSYLDIYDSPFQAALGLAVQCGWTAAENEGVSSFKQFVFCPRHSEKPEGDAKSPPLIQHSESIPSEQPELAAVRIMSALDFLGREAKAIGMSGVDELIRKALRKADDFFE